MRSTRFTAALPAIPSYARDLDHPRTNRAKKLQRMTMGFPRSTPWSGHGRRNDFFKSASCVTRLDGGRAKKLYPVSRRTVAHGTHGRIRRWSVVDQGRLQA